MRTLLRQGHIYQAFSLKETTRRLRNRIFSIIVSILHSLLIVVPGFNLGNEERSKPSKGIFDPLRSIKISDLIFAEDLPAVHTMCGEGWCVAEERRRNDATLFKNEINSLQTRHLLVSSSHPSFRLLRPVSHILVIS